MKLTMPALKDLEQRIYDIAPSLSNENINNIILSVLAAIDATPLADYELDSILTDVASGRALESIYGFKGMEAGIKLQLPMIYEAYQDLVANRKYQIRCAEACIKAKAESDALDSSCGE